MTGAEQRQAGDADYAYCEELLRREDRDSWLASLFIPQAYRRHVHALYAFSSTLARVRDIASEPLLGEIRFQWWHDALAGTEEGNARANPIAAAVLDTIARYDLPQVLLLDLIEARRYDVYSEAITTTSALEAYTDTVCANLFRLVRLIIEGEEGMPGLGVARHAGIAHGIVGLMRALPWQHARGQLLVPAEVLQAHGASREDVSAGQATPGVLAALAELRALARNHLDTFDARLHGIPDKSRPAFLTVSLCEPYLQQMEKPGYDPFRTMIELPQWRRQWILWRAAHRWS